jgi:hypothetical protein
MNSGSSVLTGKPSLTFFDEAQKQMELLGSKDFYVSRTEMLKIVKHVISRVPAMRLIVNRPQTGGRSFVHRLLWRGMTFVCVTKFPIGSI